MALNVPGYEDQIHKDIDGTLIEANWYQHRWQIVTQYIISR